MQTNVVLEETQTFITKQREVLLTQRETIFGLQADLQRQLDEVNAMLAKFDVFEGKAAPRQAGARRMSGARRGSRRAQLLQVIKDGGGLTRGEILEKIGIKGDKKGEMSVSNALTALAKGNQVARRDGKYVVM